MGLGFQQIPGSMGKNFYYWPALLESLGKPSSAQIETSMSIRLPKCSVSELASKYLATLSGLIPRSESNT